MLADSYKNAEVLKRFTKDGKGYARIKLTCDRCGGRGIYAVGVLNGHLVPAGPDGGVCYKCAGSGYTVEDVRDYTEKEFATIQKTKETKARKAAEAREARAKIRLAEQNKNMLISHGFNGTEAYLLIGNTFPIKDTLKEHGAKFSYELLWVCPDEPTWLEECSTECSYVKVSADQIFEICNDRICIKKDAPAFVTSLQPKRGKFLGTEGQRITVTATVNKILEYRNEYLKGWPTTSYQYVMSTADGDVVTWHTSAVDWSVGETHTFVGTIKRLGEYNFVRQTVMTRCKEVQLSAVKK